MKSVRALIFLLPLILSAPFAIAAVPDGFDEVEVAVADRETATREAGFRRALDALLIRMTGRRDVATDARFDDLRANVAHYVGAWRYEEAGGELRLWVRLDGGAVETVLAGLQVAVWGRDRPVTLVWLVVQDAGGRSFVGGESWPDAQRALDRAAHERGLPTLLPLLDLEDRSLLDPADVTAGFRERIEAASVRYAPGAVLAAHVAATPSGRWVGRVAVDHVGERLESRLNAEGLDAAIVSAVDFAAETLARRLAVTPGATPEVGRVRVRVEGLVQFADFERVRRALESLAPVVGVRPVALEGDAAEFDLDVRGSARDVERAAAVGATFGLVPRGDEAVEGAAVLLRLLP